MQATGKAAERDLIKGAVPIIIHAYVQNNPIIRIDLKGLVCGSGWTDSIIPDAPFGYKFIPCCEEHDKCYEGKDVYCKTPRWKCDMQFLNCMRLKCNDSILCYDIANVYYISVRVLGNCPFKNARK